MRRRRYDWSGSSAPRTHSLAQYFPQFINILAAKWQGQYYIINLTLIQAKAALEGLIPLHGAVLAQKSLERGPQWGGELATMWSHGAKLHLGFAGDSHSGCRLAKSPVDIQWLSEIEDISQVFTVPPDTCPVTAIAWMIDYPVTYTGEHCRRPSRAQQITGPIAGPKLVDGNCLGYCQLDLIRCMISPGYDRTCEASCPSDEFATADYFKRSRQRSCSNIAFHVSWVQGKLQQSCGGPNAGLAPFSDSGRRFLLSELSTPCQPTGCFGCGKQLNLPKLYCRHSVGHHLLHGAAALRILHSKGTTYLTY